MNRFKINRNRFGVVLATAAMTAMFVASCATTPQSPPGAADVRAKLTRLQADSDLASRAPIEIREAEAAVRLAELARNETERARDAAAARAAHDAELARVAAEKALALAAEDASREKAELQRQIDLLQARETERGLVLTLGNVLFASGRAELKTSGKDGLNNLVAFLNQYRDRNVMIEGHTDSVGSEANNLALSTRRAESVKSYLLQQGVAHQRINSIGLGETRPIKDNDTETGRQQNRRVEVVVLDSPRQQVTAVISSRE